MKKLFVLLTISMFATFGFSTSNHFSIEEEPLRKVEINMTVTATNGCNYTIKGWIEVDLNPISSDFLTVTAYNINVTSPCGDLDVTATSGKSAPSTSTPNDIKLTDSQLKEILLDIINNEIIIE